jgi:hypothetical protein
MLNPSKRLRQHPDDPNVWEYPVGYVRSVFPRAPCRGCPERINGDTCPDGTASQSCKENTVWYGEHIEVANKLEGI